MLLHWPAMKRRIAVDLSVLRESRNLRLLVIGELFSGLGAQAALVAIPFQVYTLTHSAALVGLLGIVELVPIVAACSAGRSPTEPDDDSGARAALVTPARASSNQHCSAVITINTDGPENSHTRTAMIRSSPSRGEPRPSRLDVATHSVPSGAATTVRMRP